MSELADFLTPALARQVEAELKTVCARFPTRQYDNDALYHMKIGTADLTPSDGAHLTTSGLRKQAALEWASSRCTTSHPGRGTRPPCP